MKSILAVAKSFFEGVPADGVIGDFTMGNGSDTLFFSGLVPQGQVYAFDIQEQALINTRARLEEHGAGENVRLIHSCHSRLDDYIPGQLDGGMFNLGYLPTSDHVLTTKRETTLLAVQKAVAKLKVGAPLVIVVYPGHPEGAAEGELLQEYARTLSDRVYDATIIRIFNIPDCPYIIAIERRK